MYRNLFGILAVFAVALLLVALTFSATAENEADFRFNNGTEPKSLDPHVMTGQPEGRVADAIFEGLMVRDPKTLRPVPGVAREMPEVSADRTMYTFRLRENARWSDGVPITAADFAWSWRRLQEPDLGSEYAYIHHMIRGAAVYKSYGANARAIREDILPKLEALAAAHPEGLDAADWQGFLAEVHAAEALKNVQDGVLSDALTKREGALARDDLARIGEALALEGARRQELFERAEAHYGINMGVFALEDDPYTLVVELEAPTPFFLDIVAFYSSHPVPRHLVDVRDEENKRVNEQDWFKPGKIVSNGPWRMVSWRANDKIRLEPNEYYWDEAFWDEDPDVPGARPRVVHAHSIENATTALNLYLTDRLDWLNDYPADLVDQLRKRDDFYSNPGLVVYYYRFNTTRPPLDDPKVRLALCMAIDRKLIVEEVMRLGQLPAYHLVPPGLAGYERPESRIRFDPEEARRLLAEAGFPNGKGWPENTGVLYNTSESHKKVAEVVADQLRRNLGIDIQPVNQEWQAYQATMLKLAYWMSRAGWIGDYLDPNTFLDMWVTNGGNNQTGWGDPLYDRLVKTAANVDVLLEESESLFLKLEEPDRARDLLAHMRAADTEADRLAAGARLRMHLFREAETIIVQDAFPICPIYFYVVSGLVKPNVKGFYSQLVFDDGTTGDNLQDIHPVRGIRVKR